MSSKGIAIVKLAHNGDNRIVSGWEANDGDIPYQLSLRIVTIVGAVFTCGATIIHNEWGLTAAHCTVNRHNILIRAGGVSLSRPRLFFETTEYYNHPLYVGTMPFVQPHDISVIKFNRFVEYTPYIQPIRLQSSVDRNKNYDGVRLMASGWGRLWTDGPSPTILNWVYLRGVSNHFCWQSYGQSNIIVDSTICASGYNVITQSICQGDSGGPLVVEDVDGVLSQVGISSFLFGTGCNTESPAGFVRPGHYHDWITEVTGINLDWDPNARPSTTIAPEVPTTASPESEGESEGEDEGDETDIVKIKELAPVYYY
ncbi:collagenase-like [Melitaea cinxia]|uniref:collagenase-like n=1 Tax=Melitaea cinxia TaxID=113334 RepID=UPI001E2738BF|nr:collagenase-like [Melitaea cinxia]